MHSSAILRSTLLLLACAASIATTSSDTDDLSVDLLMGSYDVPSQSYRPVAFQIRVPMDEVDEIDTSSITAYVSNPESVYGYGLIALRSGGDVQAVTNVNYTYDSDMRVEASSVFDDCIPSDDNCVVEWALEMTVQYADEDIPLDFQVVLEAYDSDGFAPDVEIVLL